MTVLSPIREDWVAPYLAAAFREAGGDDRVAPAREIELLRQTIAMAEAQVNVASIHALPPDDAPLRAALVQAVGALRAALYPGDAAGSIEEALHSNNAWNAMRRLAQQRLAALAR